MRIGWFGLLFAGVVCLLSTSDAGGAVIFTTGITNETGSAGPVTFTNYGGGGVTSIDSAGRQVRNLSTSSQTADITFSFSTSQNVSFGTSEIVRIYIGGSQVATTPTPPTNQVQVVSVDGVAVSSATVVNIVTGGGLIGYNLPFTLSTPDSSVTSITIRITLTNRIARVNIDAFATPEPGAFALLGLGLLGAGGWAWRRRRSRSG